MASLMLCVADFETDAPNTEMVETSARPTMSADAVCAVRRGLRIEFCRPRRPETPRASGRPMTLDIGRATRGANMPTPTKIATAPRPTSWIAGSDSPRAKSTIPRIPTTEPTATRRREDSSVLPCWLVSAAIGGIRTARRAGLMAEITVTPIPIANDATTVRASKTNGP